jgi:hypothetical protein
MQLRGDRRSGRPASGWEPETMLYRLVGRCVTVEPCFELVRQP